MPEGIVRRWSSIFDYLWFSVVEFSRATLITGSESVESQETKVTYTTSLTGLRGRLVN